MNRPSRWLLVVAFATVYTVWGSTYLAIRVSVETMPPFLATGARLFAAGVILFIFAKLRGEAWPSRIEWRSAIIVGGFLFLLDTGSIAWAEAHGVPSGIAAVLIATLPMWMVVLTWLRPGGKYPGNLVIVGLVIGFGGIIVLADTDAASVNPVGVVALLIGAFGWAFGSLYAKRAPLPKSAALSNGMELMCGGAMQLVCSLLLGEPGTFNPAQVSALSLLALAYLAIVSSIFTFSAFMWLMRVSTPAKVSTYAYVNPVIAVVLGWLLAAEPLTARTLIAVGVIIGAVLLVNLASSRSLPRLRAAKVAAEATP